MSSPSSIQKIAYILQLLSESQRMVLYIIPMITSPLSIFGSSCIIYRIMKNKNTKNNWNIFHRMMLGTSAVDVLVSINLALSTLPLNTDLHVPVEVWGAHGNEFTCSLSGFFMNLAQTVSFYNTFTLIYLTVFVFRNIRSEQIPTSIEWFIHLFSILFPTAFGLYAVFKGYMNPNPTLTRCFVASYPPLCHLFDDVECTRGPAPDWLFNTMFLIPQYTAFAVSLLCILLLQSKVLWAAFLETNITNVTASNRENAFQTYNREITIQSILYAINFTNTFAWTVLPNAFIDKKNYDPAEYVDRMYPYFVLGRIFLPLQGFTNMLIYFGPRYRRIRKIRPERCRLWAFTQSIVGPAIVDGTYYYHNNHHNQNANSSAQSYYSRNSKVSSAAISSTVGARSSQTESEGHTSNSKKSNEHVNTESLGHCEIDNVVACSEENHELPPVNDYEESTINEIREEKELHE